MYIFLDITLLRVIVQYLTLMYAKNTFKVMNWSQQITKRSRPITAPQQWWTSVLRLLPDETLGIVA